MAKYRLKRSPEGLYTFTGTLLEGREIRRIATVSNVRPDQLLEKVIEVATLIDDRRKQLKAARGNPR